MKLSFLGDNNYTRTIIDCDGTIYILLTPEFISRFEKMEKFLELNYRYFPPKSEFERVEWGGSLRCITSDGRNINMAEELNKTERLKNITDQ